MATIAALNYSMLLLLRCDVVLLFMIKAAKPSWLVSRLSSSFTYVSLLAYPWCANVPAPMVR